jgi:AcrR family transcriptional regulator
MADAPTSDPRRAIAERNVEAILDGAERLLARGEQASISAAAAAAGVSRPTVYAHFPGRERLLEALVERAVRRASAAIESAELDRGPAAEALQRLIAAGWRELDHNEDIARASAAALSADAMRRAHETVRAAIRRLVERGRREGAFRSDVPVGWLVTSCLALIHAAAEAVRAGELESERAAELLSVTVADLFAARAVSRPGDRTARRAASRSR